MYIPDFRYHKPQTAAEACRILEANPGSAPIAGGTDLLVEIKQGLRAHSDIISLNSIPELHGITLNDEGLVIGAAVTHNEIAHSPVVQGFCGAIADAASWIGTDQIRNTGTIGGNLCTGASCCDSAPVLIALNALVRITGTAGEREVPLRDFFVTHKETRLKRGELLTEITIPGLKEGTRTAFEKFGLREAASVSVVSAAVSLRIQPSGICTDPCVVLGAVAPTPIICMGANRVLHGRSLSELSGESSAIESAADAAAEESVPIDDIRGSADYRREIIRTLVKRVVRKALDLH